MTYILRSDFKRHYNLYKCNAAWNEIAQHVPRLRSWLFGRASPINTNITDNWNNGLFEKNYNLQQLLATTYYIHLWIPYTANQLPHGNWTKQGNRATNVSDVTLHCRMSQTDRRQHQNNTTFTCTNWQNITGTGDKLQCDVSTVTAAQQTQVCRELRSATTCTVYI